MELSQQRVSKLEAELDRTKLSLREAREEVQRAARDSVQAVSKSEHRKLLEEVQYRVFFCFACVCVFFVWLPGIHFFGCFETFYLPFYCVVLRLVDVLRFLGLMRCRVVVCQYCVVLEGERVCVFCFWFVFFMTCFSFFSVLCLALSCTLYFWRSGAALSCRVFFYVRAPAFRLVSVFFSCVKALYFVLSCLALSCL